MHIRDWPPGERPREKLLKRGATVLSDAELLAIFLGSGLRGLDAVATARQLLADHGPPRRLLERSEEHTSELQSLMRISYAVFYLTKQTPSRMMSYNTQQ